MITGFHSCGLLSPLSVEDHHVPVLAPSATSVSGRKLDPDFGQQAISDGVWTGTTLRTTWQLSSRQKINLFWDEQDMCRNCWGGGSATTSPEAQDGSQNINWIHAYQASYTAPLTSKILVEAGFGAVNPSYGNPRDGFDRSIVRTVDDTSGAAS